MVLGIDRQRIARWIGWLADREDQRRRSWRAARAHAQAAQPAGVVQKLWAWFADLARRSRSALAVVTLVFAACLLLIGTPQGLDICYGVASSWGVKTDDSFWKAFKVTAGIGIATFCSTLWLAIQSWFWIRSVFDDVYEDVEGDPRYFEPQALYKYGPPAVGGLPFFTMAICFLISGVPLPTNVLFFALFSISGASFLWVVTRPKYVDVSDKRPQLAGAMFFRWATYTCCVLAMILLVAYPVFWSQVLGPVGTVFLGISLIIPVLATLLHASRSVRLPVFGFVLVAVVAMTGLVDNHAVGRRAFGGGFSPVFRPSDRPNLEEDFCSWVKAQATTVRCRSERDGAAPGPPQEHALPIVFVAAEGGASRAGYWTGDVLDALDGKAHGDFGKELYLISSVSGGSVGAVAYISQKRLRQEFPCPRIANGACKDDTDAIRGVTSADFLSPALGGMLFPDLAQRFFPFPILPDRAETLERALEKGWRHAHLSFAPGAKQRNATAAYALDAWNYPFLDIWTTTSQRLPALIINGEREEDGRRILTSNLKLDPAAVPDAVDFFQLSEQDVRASTAILNGARFPVVSPGGTLTREGRADGHVLDGGYFDGGGMITLRDVAAAIMKIAAKKGVVLKPIFVEINNDSDTPDSSPELYRATSALSRCKGEEASIPSYCEVIARRSGQNPCDLARSSTSYFGADILGPLLGLYQARGGHGTAASMQVAQEISDASLSTSSPWGFEPEFHIIHLHREGGIGLPMDWVLSKRAQRIADLQLSTDAGHAGCGGASDGLQAVVDAINFPRAPSKVPSKPPGTSALVCDPPAKLRILPEL